MPMIEAKVTVNLPEEKRNVLKAELGKAITIIGKPESYLMINLIDKQDLYFAGKKLEKGAYVEVKVLGSVDSGASGKMIKIAFSYMSEFYSYHKIFHICLHLLHLLVGE